MRNGIVVTGLAFVSACADSPSDPNAVRKLEAPLASVGQVVQTVQGSAHIETAGELRTFTFSARKFADNTVTGEFQIIARQVDRVTHGRVTCLTVMGNAVRDRRIS
jgi:hypothetical protein